MGHSYFACLCVCAHAYRTPYSSDINTSPRLACHFVNAYNMVQQASAVATSGRIREKDIVTEKYKYRTTGKGKNSESCRNVYYGGVGSRFQSLFAVVLFCAAKYAYNMQSRISYGCRRCHAPVSYTHLTLPTNREV